MQKKIKSHDIQTDNIVGYVKDTVPSGLTLSEDEMKGLIKYVYVPRIQKHFNINVIPIRVMNEMVIAFRYKNTIINERQKFINKNEINKKYINHENGKK